MYYRKSIRTIMHIFITEINTTLHLFRFPERCFVLIMNCTLSHMLGRVTPSANDQLYTIKINKDFLKRGAISYNIHTNMIMFIQSVLYTFFI